MIFRVCVRPNGRQDQIAGMADYAATSPGVAVKRALDGWTPAAGKPATCGPGVRLVLRRNETVTITVKRIN